MPFDIPFRIEPRAEPLEPLSSEYLRTVPPLTVATDGLRSRFSGGFTVPLGEDLALLVDPDLIGILRSLPAWLARLAEEERPAPLLFGAQGTELELVGERRGNTITVEPRS